MIKVKPHRRGRQQSHVHTGTQIQTHTYRGIAATPQTHQNTDTNADMHVTHTYTMIKLRVTALGVGNEATSTLVSQSVLPEQNQGSSHRSQEQELQRAQGGISGWLGDKCHLPFSIWFYLFLSDV